MFTDEKDNGKMNTFEQLSRNKGTVSSKLGKTLAQKVLEDGDSNILYECIDLASFDATSPASKHIRAGAAKVVEIVAEKQPERVAPHLETLLPALSVSEPQTRWMIIRVMGFCAGFNKPVAQKAITHAEKYINAKEGLVIASSADLFLGDFGSISKENTQRVFPILKRSMETALANEQDWLLESLFKVYPNLDSDNQEKVLKFAEHWQASSRKSTQHRARKILRLK
jgi:hypothetical protein